jgi:hypothetical protein
VAVLLSSTGRVQAAAPPLNGDYRLLLSFPEDGAIVQKGFFEAGGRFDDDTTGDDIVGGVTVAVRYGRDVEAGLFLGAIHRTRDAGAELFGTTLTEPLSTTGPADLSLYGKYRILRSPLDVAVGGLVDLPLADGNSGITSGAASGQGFVGLRKAFSSLTLAGHAGIGTAEKARFGEDAPGTTFVSAGTGLLIPLAPLWVLITEVDYEGNRFEGEGASAQALVGLDWRPTENFIVRGGISFGLTEAAPDVSLAASLAFHL